jgi:hypothetical protein
LEWHVNGEFQSAVLLPSVDHNVPRHLATGDLDLADIGHQVPIFEDLSSVERDGRPAARAAAELLGDAGTARTGGYVRCEEYGIVGVERSQPVDVTSGEGVTELCVDLVQLVSNRHVRPPLMAAGIAGTDCRRSLPTPGGLTLTRR